MAHDVFISHSSVDKTVADAVCAKLEAHKIRCWIAPRDIIEGVAYPGQIVQGIKNCRVMVLIFTSHANESEHVFREVERAAHYRKLLLPFRIEDIVPSEDMEYFLATPHWLDAITPPLEEHLDSLAEKLKRLLERLPTTESVSAPIATVISSPPPSIVEPEPVPSAEKTSPAAKDGAEKERPLHPTPAAEASSPAGQKPSVSPASSPSEPNPPSASPVSSPVSRDSATRETKINPVDGAEMVYIPAGEFLMGDDKHKVILPGYYVYKNLVTVAKYKKFCRETKRQMPEAPDFDPNWSKEDHPIVNVSWNNAKAYCDWAGVSLPTEAQWEKAARGTDGRKYPWGDEWDASKCANSGGTGLGRTVAVGRYTDSPYGLSDMAGNVWQWCADDYDGSGEYRALRGGSWGYVYPIDFRCAYRVRYATSDWHDYFGFRCASREDFQ